jgi:hypothetical protein
MSLKKTGPCGPFRGSRGRQIWMPGSPHYQTAARRGRAFRGFMACSHVRFKVSGTIIRFPAPEGCSSLGGHGRRQDPKTPVEQALMRGLVTA